MTALAYAGPMPAVDSLPVPIAARRLATALDDFERGARYAAEAKSPRTVAAYAIDLADFAGYCQANGLAALPATPQTIVAYCAHLIDRVKISTLRRRLVAISQEHKRHGFDSPTAHRAVREAMKGIARNDDVQLRSRTTKKTALTNDMLAQTLAALDRSTLLGKRDAAILLLGLYAALRRSEIAALDVDDLAFDERGVIVTIRRSKTDQEGAGVAIDVPRLPNPGLCAVRALRTWLAAAALERGPLFRTFGLDRTMQPWRIDPRDVARVVQRCTRRAGIAGDFSGHSLRRGYVTTGIRKGIAAAALMQRTRHKSLAVFQGYVDEARLFLDNPLKEMFG